MSSNGVPPSDSSGSDWIDRVLERAEEQAPERPPVVPDPVTTTDQLPSIPTARPVTEELSEIRWADTPEVRPASEPIAPQPAMPVMPTAAPSAPMPPATGSLTSEAVGRSAWADDLRSLGSSEPEGWDRLSWDDMDGSSGQGAPPAHDPSPFVTMIREWGPVLLAAVVIAVAVRLVLVQAYHIPSLSMAPTLEEGDRVIVNRLSYRFGEIERGQVVVFGTPPNQPSDADDLIKRVIGLPGETVTFRDGQVFVDELLVEEPYLAQQNSSFPRSIAIPGCAQETPEPDRCVVPEGFVFVMGDNRTGSQDSRAFGPVDTDTVVGRAFLRVWPFSSFGRL
ncbi:MAG: signal peptidase I [Actinomycetota bacterium]